MNSTIAKKAYLRLPKAVRSFAKSAYLRLPKFCRRKLGRTLQERITDYHANSPDPDIRALLAPRSRTRLSIYNYAFTAEYVQREVDVRRDPDCGLFYVVENGRKLYFKRSFNTVSSVAQYYNAMCMEQDPRSPHCYTTAAHAVSGGVVLDLGAAEGLFALRAVDHADALVLFECDEGWIEALQHTFRPDAGKVRIVPKFVGDVDHEHGLTLDTFARKMVGEIKFIKMDIEGAEIRTLSGAAVFRAQHPNCRWSICAYHRAGDENRIRAFFKGGHVAPAPGYILYLLDPELDEPFFRRGVIYVDPADEGRGLL